MFSMQREKDAASVVSLASSGTRATAESSDSNSRSSCLIHTAKRLKRESINSAHTKFKGVVPQQNGHWGAQIYCNHKRIWIGTFKTEAEAAMAYDSAAIKVRSGDCHRNFPWTSFNLQEPEFQNLYSTDIILNMIKDGSYPSKFIEFLNTQLQKVDNNDKVGMPSQQNEGFLCGQLFQKELTPSDVGKLNRLVIPKKYAVKYFPPIPESAKHNGSALNDDDLELAFYDRLMKVWKFRYCYWTSSQSYVFTRGWNRFVRETDLKAKDVVTFYKCESNDGAKKGQSFYMIDVASDGGDRSGNKSVDQRVLSQTDLSLGLGMNVVADEEVKEGLSEATTKSGIMLFGVQIG